jgi:hypothetical protein
MVSTRVQGVQDPNEKEERSKMKKIAGLVLLTLALAAAPVVVFATDSPLQTNPPLSTTFSASTYIPLADPNFPAQEVVAAAPYVDFYPYIGFRLGSAGLGIPITLKVSNSVGTVVAEVHETIVCCVAGYKRLNVPVELVGGNLYR